MTKSDTHMKIPVHLKHKPIIQVENYDRIDGPYADDTDAMGLSVGIAQWNGPGWTELSAKVWRNTGENGRVSPKSYLFIGLSTWQHLFASQWTTAKTADCLRVTIFL